MATTYKRIEAVHKACEILAFLGRQKEPMSGQDIAKAVNMAQGTVMCHLATLEDNGFVQQVGGAWRIGMVLALFWARKKADLESERQRIDNDLEKLGGE